jgi:16S rRNA G966 N2-methylase RsmD
LQQLGWQQPQIIRSKSLENPFIKIGSKKRQIKQVPDYLFKVEDSYAWVLDAKAPTELIVNSDNVEQIYSYAIHPEVRTKFFALCNGKEFVLYRVDETKPILFFQLSEIEAHWENLALYLSPNSFQSGKKLNYNTLSKPVIQNRANFDYLAATLLREIPVKKQAAKRHFGVHGYFTKQSWNVVQEYIKNFSQVGDVVLDPFGGSGVTAIETLMTGRKAIHIDLNPMSVFMVDALITPINNGDLKHALERIKKAYEKSEYSNFDNLESTKQQELLAKYPYPKNVKLPKGSDVQSIEQLFTEKQLAQLAFLKSLIKKEKNKNVKKSLLLAFSSTITKVNLTNHGSPKGGSDSAAFKYYRYRIAKEPSNFNVIETYAKKVLAIINAKKEITFHINESTLQNAQILKGTATDLQNITLAGFENLVRFKDNKGIGNETVDYIYTDPPYGKKIPYLDLSVMWNGWLDLEVSEADYELEAIEGGEHHKSKENYNELMTKSIQEMYRVLKFDRWMSFVFAHKDPEFWHLIIETAEKCGFEYAGAVPQKNGQTSFKKRQNPFTVLSGQLIINFRKVRKPKFIMKAALGMNIGEIVQQTVEGIIAKENGATLEQINDELIIKGLELGFLDLLKKEYSDLTPFLLTEFDFNAKTEIFSLRKNAKFKSHLDVKLRIRYYLVSYLRRMELEKKTPTFDEIIYQIIPLLKNGTTPENQTVLNVLEDIAERVGSDGWVLKKDGQLGLFGDL